VPKPKKPASPFRYLNPSPEIIRLVVMMYVRFPLSLGKVEDLLAERGIDICHETVRFWWNRFTANMSKAKRTGKIFIDWLRNQRGATAVVPFSARARPGAPVAVPIAWEELAGFADAHPFAIGDAEALIERSRSAALKGWGYAAQALPAV